MSYLLHELTRQKFSQTQESTILDRSTSDCQSTVGAERIRVLLQFSFVLRLRLFILNSRAIFQQKRFWRPLNDLYLVAVRARNYIPTTAQILWVQIVIKNFFFEETMSQLSLSVAENLAIRGTRPLCPMSSDPNDMTALTAGHFLIGCPLNSIPEPSTLDLIN